MPRTFKVGDHVTWNSEAGRVSGKIIKVHTKDVDYKGYTHHASTRAPSDVVIVITCGLSFRKIH